MSDPMDTIRDIVYPGRRAPVTPISDDIQAAGDDLRDADDYADYHYPIPFPPRKEDLA
jgi:hypothetical protein